jgi:hypothetical protein
MEEKDRWSVIIEYLKLEIALSTAVIAAAATIYGDSSKIPGGSANFWLFDVSNRYLLFTAVIGFFLTLLASVSALICFSNHFVAFPSGAASSALASRYSAEASASAATAAHKKVVASLAAAKTPATKESKEEADTAAKEANEAFDRAKEAAERAANQDLGGGGSPPFWKSTKVASRCANTSLGLLLLSSALLFCVFFFAKQN